MKFLFPLLLLPLTVAVAQPPVKPPTLADLNKQAVEVLRVQHDRGADLYNAGDAAGAVKVYETALGTVSAFLAHQPAVRKTITDGILDARKADGDKARAFKLHEVIELVRADLRIATKKLETEPTTPRPALSGTLVVKGKPLAGADVVVASLNQAEPRVFVSKTGPDGKYAFAKLPPGEYVVIVSDGRVSAKYQTTDLSGLRVKVTAGGTVSDFDLK